MYSVIGDLVNFADHVRRWIRHLQHHNDFHYLVLDIGSSSIVMFQNFKSQDPLSYILLCTYLTVQMVHKKCFFKLNQALNCWELRDFELEIPFWIHYCRIKNREVLRWQGCGITLVSGTLGSSLSEILWAHPSFQMGCVLFLSLCDLELWGGIVFLRIFWCFTIQCDSDVKMYISLYFQEKVFNWWQNGTSLVLEWG